MGNISFLLELHESTAMAQRKTYHLVLTVKFACPAVQPMVMLAWFVKVQCLFLLIVFFCYIRYSLLIDKTTIPSNCTHGSVRLVGGLKLHEGIVEVCVNSVWFGVCSTNRDRFLGDVVCKQLGFLYQGS